ncbi:MAG: Fic family protein [Bacteroidetes bacterium]|nr:Fic family protein [Bacteroidota bacterium]
MQNYIHQLDTWPHFTWKPDEIINLLSEARYLQGRLLGRMESLDFDLRSEATLETLTLDVLKSSEIEGEYLIPDQVRSSIARRLGMDMAGLVDSDRNVDGVVEMVLDATQNCFEPLTVERLFDWHASLFPTGRSGMHKITVGNWRTDSTGPMEVVSGAMGKERVHFQAPDASLLHSEIKRFLTWFNSNSAKTPGLIAASSELPGSTAAGAFDLVLKAALAHLWFVTIHPFDDGNGRIARALSDMLLAQSDRSAQRFYSMSAQIRIERKQYYAILEKTQKGSLDITKWVTWFLNCLINSLKSTDDVLNRVLVKAEFWNRHSQTALNDRQRKLLNRLLDGFDGNLTSSRWAKIAKCSRDTAIRDINDLIEKGILQVGDAGGRSTHYILV